MKAGDREAVRVATTRGRAVRGAAAGALARAAVLLVRLVAVAGLALPPLAALAYLARRLTM